MNEMTASTRNMIATGELKTPVWPRMRKRFRKKLQKLFYRDQIFDHFVVV